MGTDWSAVYFCLSLSLIGVAKTLHLSSASGIYQSINDNLCLVLWLSQLEKAVEAELRQKGLQVTPFAITKVIQLYETKNSRHSSMLVGKTGSGKSVTWRILQRALTAMHNKKEPGFQHVQVSPAKGHAWPYAMVL